MKKIVEPFEEIKYIAETFSEDRPVLHQSIRRPTYMNACLRGTIVILFGAHVHLAMINAFFGYNSYPQFETENPMFGIYQMSSCHQSCLSFKFMSDN